MSNIDIEAVRKRAWHFLEPRVAAAAGMTIFEMQQFIAGQFMPTETQLDRLAKQMGVQT